MRPAFALDSKLIQFWEIRERDALRTAGKMPALHFPNFLSEFRLLMTIINFKSQIGNRKSNIIRFPDFFPAAARWRIFRRAVCAGERGRELFELSGDKPARISDWRRVFRGCGAAIH